MGIIVKDVTKTFGSPPVKALSHVSLKIEDGDFIALTGKSGSGKSTLLYLLSTLDFATEGSIRISDQDVRKLTARELSLFRNQRMGFVFQFHYLISELSALENVLLPTRKEHKRDDYVAYAQELLERFELLDKRDRLPHHLSGGEQQRVAIARALIMKPQYLFTDEPTGSLDTTNGHIVMNILKDVNETKKTTVIMVTHDQDFASVARKQIQLQDGMVLGGSA